MTNGAGPDAFDTEVDNDVVLHVEVSGSGQPLVLLHGFTGDISTMAGLAGPLSGDHRVIVPDLVGHGGSGIPDRVGAYGVGQMASHVSTLCERLGHPEFDLVGYSMGGRVALTLACNEPGRVRSLALIGASAGLVDADQRDRRRADDEALADRIESAGLDGFVDEWMSKPLFAGQKRLGSAHMAQARQQRLANDPHGLAMSLRGGGTGAMDPLHDRLPKCDIPTVFIAGHEDPKFTAIAEELAATMPNAVVELIAGAGHAAHVEQPKAVVDVIRAHISAVEAR